MADVLGIASEEAYPYKGVSDYCHSDIPHAAKFANVRRTTLITLHDCLERLLLRHFGRDQHVSVGTISTQVFPRIATPFMLLCVLLRVAEVGCGARSSRRCG